MFAQLIGQWFKSGVCQNEVMIGSVFRNIRNGNIIETARVLDIVPDSLGVPHVLFTVSLGSASQNCVEEQRTLGLDTFAEKFPSALPA